MEPLGQAPRASEVMSDRTNGLPAHQKDKPVAEKDAEGAALLQAAPGGAELAVAGASAPAGTASAPTDPPELESAAILQQCVPLLAHASAHASVCVTELHRAPCGERGGASGACSPHLLPFCANLHSLR